MKCICGYEYETIKDYHGLNVIVGDKPFIRITPPMYFNSIEEMQTTSIDYEYIQYACPKCGTVKVDI